MTHIITLNGDAPRDRANQDANRKLTKREVFEMIVHIAGPQAQLLVEFDDRLRAVEARVGIVVPPVFPEPPEPGQTSDSGDVE